MKLRSHFACLIVIAFFPMSVSVASGPSIAAGKSCQPGVPNSAAKKLKLVCTKITGRYIWERPGAVSPNSKPNEISIPNTVTKLDPSFPKVDGTCSYPQTPWRIGYDYSNLLVILNCSPNGQYKINESGPQIDQKTRLPIAAPMINGKPVFSDECQFDPKVPAQWSDMQLWSTLNQDGCARPYRYEQGSTNFASPKSTLSPQSSFLSIQSCAINEPGSRRLFPRLPDFFTPTLNANIQVVPLEFPDYKTDKSPSDDYGKYFQFGADYLRNTSDVPINPNYIIPSKYIEMPDDYAKYGLANVVGKPDVNSKFFQDIVTKVGTTIDMSNVSQVLFVIAPTTPKDWNVQIFGDTSHPLEFATGKVGWFYLMSSSALGPRLNPTNSADPWLMVHEQFGHDAALNDEYGSIQGDSNPPLPPLSGGQYSLEQLGTGTWGLMSMWHGEPLVWDKWQMGYVRDSQIACLSPTSTSTVWLRPSTTKGDFQKAAIIPISQTKLVVIESERSTGYNYKIPVEDNGALVYTVDITKLVGESQSQNGMGVVVIRPSNRANPPVDSTGFVDADATLKQGESVTVSGLTIRNIEKGEFGDVIQVQGGN
jgi:hypothetical protein